MFQKTRLSPLEVEFILSKLSVDGNTRQATKRLINYLAVNPESITVDVNRSCSIGNISHYSTKYINPKIRQYGYQIGCERPPFPVLNKYGEYTQQHLWSFYRLDTVDLDQLPDAANDDEAEELAESFGNDLDEALK